MKKLLLTLLIFICSNTFAQRLAGSEIYYERTGNRQYKITAVVYRECDSDPLNSLNTYVFAGNLNQSINMTRVSIEKINDTCGNPCNIKNDVGNAGFEKHIYEGTIDFNSGSYSGFISNAYCNVNVAIRQGGRDNRTNTHGTGMYYNEASINICDSTVSNSSPRFSMEPKFYASLNQPLSYSPGPKDTDGSDSMAFSIEPVLTDYNTPILYNSGYSYTIPLTPYCPPNPGYTECRALPNAKPPRGFYFDNNVCTIITTPTNTDMAYIRIKIREFKKINNVWKEMGAVSRDFMIQPKVNPKNYPPYFVSIPTTPDLNICSNTYSFDITAKDDIYLPYQSIADTTHLVYDYGYLNSTYQVQTTSRERTAQLTLKGDTSKITKTHYFTIGAYDKLCNINLITKTYKVTTSPIIDYTTSYTLDSCQVFTGQVAFKDTTLKYPWTIDVIQPDLSKLSFSPGFNIHQNGLHYLTYRVKTSNNCFVYQYDTLDISNAFLLPQMNINKDTSMCEGAPYMFGFQPATIDNLSKWEWSINDTIVNTVDSIISGTFYKMNTVNYFSKFKLKIVNDKGCESERKITVFSSTKKNFQLFQPGSYTVCPSIKTDVAINASGLKWPIKTHWEYDGQSLDTGSNSLSVKTPDALKTLLLKASVKDDNHCFYFDSVYLTSTESPYFELIADKSFCKDSTVNVQITQFNNPKLKSILWTDLSNVIVLGRDSMNLKRKVNNSEYIVATINDSNNCSYKDSLKIVPVQTPKVSLNPLQDVCEGQAIKVIAQANPAGNYQYKWRVNNFLLDSTGSSITLLQPTGKGTIYLTTDNKGECSDYDSVNYTVNPLPVVGIIGDTLYTTKDTVKLQSVNQHLLYYWTNGEKTGSYNRPASSFGPGTYQVWLRGTNQFFCVAADTITIHIEPSNLIDRTSADKISIYPNPANEQLIIQSDVSIHYQIFNSNGQVIMQGSLEEKVKAINLETLSSGVYYIEIAGIKYKFVKI